jgi:hypothetical protein
MSSINQVMHILKPVDSKPLISREATKYFLLWFSGLSVVLYGVGSYALFTFADPAFRVACFTGMALCTLMSIISFLLIESAMDKPNDLFMGIAFGSIFVRIFTAVFAFGFAQFVLKLAPFGMATGMLVTYFSYLVIELIYIHKKQLDRGQ